MFHFVAIAALVLQVLPANAKVPGNLVVDPHADAGGAGWTTSRGDAAIELIDGNAVFVIRNRGSFHQNVQLPPVSPGSYVVLLARASGERINRDGSITGLPYLHGIIAGPDYGRFIGYLQGQSLKSEAKRPNEWTTLSGVFPLPEGATAILLSLNLAERKDDPQNGSAGRFDDVALVVLPSETDARKLVADYTARRWSRNE